MTIRLGDEISANAAFPTSAPDLNSVSDNRPLGGLAALLDAFTDSLANPHRATVGQFAGTVQALHGELAFLAGQFQENRTVHAEAIDFDAVFPIDPEDAPSTLDPAYHGVMAAEELEHLCRELSQ